MTPCLDCGTVTDGPRCQTCAKPVHSRRRAERAAAAAQVSRQPWCGRCGTTADLTADHAVVSFADGGTLADGTRTLCRSCNATLGGRR